MRGIFTFAFLFVFTIAFGQSPLTKPAGSATQTTISNQVDFTVTTGQTLSGSIQSCGTGTPSIMATNILASGLTETLILTGFDFSVIPNNATITGIQVNVEGNSSNTRVGANLVQLTSNTTTVTNVGTNAATLNTNNFPNNNDAVLSYGGDGQLFGLSPAFTGAQLKALNLGVNLQFQNEFSNGFATLEIDAISITIFYEVSEGPLPVEFISLDATKVSNGVLLTWKVGTEINVKNYEVERSSNGSNFSTIGSAKATGSNQYTFTDLQANTGTVYYRVRNVDNDGKFKYSTVVSYANGKSTVQFKAFPTVTKGMVTLQHPSVSINTAIIISNMEGRTLRSLVPARGATTTPIDLGGYPTGSYVIRFQTEGGSTETFRIVKQ